MHLAILLDLMVLIEIIMVFVHLLLNSIGGMVWPLNHKEHLTLKLT